MHFSESTFTPSPCAGTGISHKDGRRQLRRTSNGLGFLLVCCGMTFLTSSYLLPLFLRAIGYHGSAMFTGYSYLRPTLYYLLVGAAFVLSFFPPGILYLVVTRTPLGRALPSQKTAPSLGIALFFLGSALALMSNLPVNWISDWIGSFWPQAESSLPQSSMIAYGSATVFSVIIYLIRTTILPAFFEEFLFRGIILGNMRRFGNGFAIFVSAFLFGIFHGNLRQIPFAFLVGLVLGYIVVRTNNIWITIAIHFFNNAFASLPEIARPLLSTATYNILYDSIFYGMFILGALAALFLLLRFRDFFLPTVSRSRNPLPLPSKLFAWISAPGTLLIIAYCAVDTFTPWI